MSLEMRGLFKESLSYSIKARKFFEKHPRNTKSVPGFYLICELNCYLHLEEYKKGLKTSRKIRDYFNTDTQNRLIGYQYVMLYHLHQAKVQNALKAF